MIQGHRKYNINLFNVYVWKNLFMSGKRHFKNVGGKINLPDGQTQMAAHSLPDLT